MVGLGTLLHRPSLRSPRSCCGAGGSSGRGRLLWALMLAIPVPLHRQHRGLDDGRAGTAAVARLRADAHRRRDARRGSRRATPSSPCIGFIGPLPGARASSSSSWSGREIAHGPGTPHAQVVPSGTPGSPGRRRDGGALVRHRRRDARGVRRARRLRPRRRHRSTSSWPATTPSAAACWPPSARSGTGTRSGSSPAGGALFLAFPARYAVGFSGFYLPLMLVALAADPPRPLHRVPQPRRQSRSGRPSGTRPSPWAARSSPSFWERRWGTCCGASRSTARAPSRCPLR